MTYTMSKDQFIEVVTTINMAAEFIRKSDIKLTPEIVAQFEKSVTTLNDIKEGK